MPPVSSLIHDGKTPEEILTLLSDGTEQILEKKNLSYTCHCSKEGFSKSLAALDEQTMHDLIYEDEGAEIICHFCHKKYHFSKEELETINKQRKNRG